MSRRGRTTMSDDEASRSRSRSPPKPRGGFGVAPAPGSEPTDAMMEAMMASAGVPSDAGPSSQGFYQAPPSEQARLQRSGNQQGLGRGDGDGQYSNGGPCYICSGDHFARDCQTPMRSSSGFVIGTVAPKIETTRLDFSRMNAHNTTTEKVVVQRRLIEYLFTPESRQILQEQTGAQVELKPDESTIELSGQAEQVKAGQRLLARVMMHCRWGHSADKVRRLLKPVQTESVLVQLSPLNNLTAVRKTLNVSNPKIVVGKDKTCDAMVPSAVCSRVHCILELDSERGSVYILDCSTNGTFLNGSRLPSKKSGKVLLSHGDELLLKDPSSGEVDFGYLVNLTDLSVRQETVLQAPRRMFTRLEATGADRLIAFA